MFYYKRYKTVCPLSHFIRKSQPKTIKTKRSVYWNENKTKGENKNRTNRFRYFFESNFAHSNRLFVLVYSNQDDKAQRYYQQL